MDGSSLEATVGQPQANEAGDPRVDQRVVSLIGCCPPLEKLDPAIISSIGSSCFRLSVSSNALERLTGLSGLQRLEILSVGRNSLKRLDGLEAVAATLTELWASYNQLERLSGIERCQRLRVLYLSNNRIREWTEVDRLAGIPNLEDLLLIGNPICGGDAQAYRLNVLQRLPRLKKLDGYLVTDDERKQRLPGEESK